MATRLPERRSLAGLSAWRVGGTAIGFCAALLIVAWMMFDHGKTVSGQESLPGITTGIAPPDANAHSD